MSSTCICIWRTTECHLLHSVTDLCVMKYFLANTTAVLVYTAFQIILKYKYSIWFWPRKLCMLRICTWEIAFHFTKGLLPITHQMHGKGAGGSAVFSRAVWTCLCSWSGRAWASWAFGNVCEGQGLRRGGFSNSYLYLSHILPCHLSPCYLNMFLRWPWLLSSPLFNSVFTFLNQSLIKLRILAQGFINMCY